MRKLRFHMVAGQYLEDKINYYRLWEHNAHDVASVGERVRKENWIIARHRENGNDKEDIEELKRLFGVGKT